MANYTVQTAAHKTLVANTEDKVIFEEYADQVEIVNRDGAAEIYYRVDGGVAIVGGNDNGVLPAAIGSVQEKVERLTATENSGKIVVSLRSSGTPTYSVLLIVDPESD